MKRLHLLPIFLIIGILYTGKMAGQSLPTVTIKLISENKDPSQSLGNFDQRVKDEIQSLLKNRYEVQFEETYANFDQEKIKGEILSGELDENTDIIVATGAMSSAILAQQEDFDKPSIATFIIDNSLQQVPLLENGSSGVDQFTYIQSSFDVQRDLETLYRIYPFKHIGIAGFPGLNNLLPVLETIFEEISFDFEAEFSFIPLTSNVEQSLQNIPTGVDAVYKLPDFGNLEPENSKAFYQGLHKKGIPAATILGEIDIDNGALMGYEAGPNILKVPRRIAINVLKILEGVNPADLPTSIPTYNETLLINMEAARECGHYPDFDLMFDAVLLNADEIETGRKLNLNGVVAEALQNNLNLSITAFNPELAQKDVALARANLLPTVTASSSLAMVDSFTAAASFGSVGRYTLFVNGELSQLVFSEPALANLAIQKFIQKASTYELKQAQLDVVLDASTAYLNALQAKTLMRIQRENARVTKENYDISKAKEAVGYTGATDINRWTSELAQRNIDLNDAEAQYRQAIFALNQILNRPVSEDVNLEDISFEEQVLIVSDQRFLNLVNNFDQLRKFTGFLVEEGLQNLPELKQIDYSIAAQDRLRKSQQRAFYLPSLGLSGTTDYTANRWQVIENELLPISQFNSRPSWNLGLGLSYNILQGGERRANLQRTKLSMAQLEDQRDLLAQQLELRIRANMESAGASFVRVNLSREAADAAADNFQLIQDSYAQGLVNVTTLIDAQNAALQTQLAAESAIYQYVLDFLNVERAIGFYYFLNEQAKRDAFYERFLTYLGRD